LHGDATVDRPSEKRRCRSGSHISDASRLDHLIVRSVSVGGWVGAASLAVGNDSWNDSWKSVCFGVERPSVGPSHGRLVSPTGDRLSPFTHLQTQFVVAVSLSRLRRQNCFVPPMSRRVTRDARLTSSLGTRNNDKLRWNERLDENTFRAHGAVARISPMFTFRRHFNCAA